jgi:hypothetical protein
MMLKKQIQWKTHIEWHFFVSNHGHNACDSVASIFKRTQRKQYSLDGKELHTSQDVAEFIFDNLKENHSSFIVDLTAQMVGTTKINGIRAFHKFTFHEGKVLAFPSSLSNRPTKIVSIKSFEVFLFISFLFYFTNSVFLVMM